MKDVNYQKILPYIDIINTYHTDRHISAMSSGELKLLKDVYHDETNTKTYGNLMCNKCKGDLLDDIYRLLSAHVVIEEVPKQKSKTKKTK